MDLNIDFCPKCGKKLPPETTFCPVCGSNLKSPQTDTIRPGTSGQTRLAAIILIVYSLPLILLCIYFYAASETLASTLFNDPAFADLANQWTDANMTEADFVSTLKTMAIFGIFAGAAGTVAAALALKRRTWVITVTLCMVSALMSALTIVGLIMGLVAFWLLYKSKQDFVS